MAEGLTILTTHQRVIILGSMEDGEIYTVEVDGEIPKSAESGMRSLGWKKWDKQGQFLPWASAREGRICWSLTL